MKAKLRPVLAGLMILFLPVLMAYSLVGEQLHEWLGVLMLLLFWGHHVLNWRWHCGLVRGRWSGLRVLQTVMDLALLVLMICTMTGGVLLSSYVFDFLPIRRGKDLGRTLHMLGAYWGLFLFDYLSIMALFAILGYSLKEVLKRLSSGRRSSQK